jgi:hypothetical protein
VRGIETGPKQELVHLPFTKSVMSCDGQKAKPSKKMEDTEILICCLHKKKPINV